MCCHRCLACAEDVLDLLFDLVHLDLFPNVEQADQMLFANRFVVGKESVKVENDHLNAAALGTLRNLRMMPGRQGYFSLGGFHCFSLLIPCDVP